VNFSATSSFSGLRLSAIQAQVNTAVLLSVEQSADVILDEAINLVPVDTGELLASGHTEVDGNTASVIFDSDHAGYVEYGTGIRGAASPGAGPYPYDPNWPGMPAQPYLRPALDMAQPEIREIFRDNIAAVLK
jgi:HK97 gp10 family phage protein